MYINVSNVILKKSPQNCWNVAIIDPKACLPSNQRPVDQSKLLKILLKRQSQKVQVKSFILVPSIYRLEQNKKEYVDLASKEVC